MKIPLLPIPLESAVRTSQPFISLASKLARVVPSLELRLTQADFPIRDREYASVAIFAGLFYFLVTFIPLSIISVLKGSFSFLFISLALSATVSISSFAYILFYPTLIVSRKINDIDRNLIFALRHLLVQIKSGVTLYDALVSVSSANYGFISEEFQRATRRMSTGTEEVQALEELVYKNPSTYFRRIIWQISNSMKAGADIASTLESLVENLSEEQMVSIRKYGAQLSPLALMYMMLAVIMPTLGITFLIVFSSFAGTQVPETIFYLILVLLIVFQFAMIGVIKNRRPPVEL